MSIKNKRPTKFEVGDLVTRHYKTPQKNVEDTGDSYGIVLELRCSENKRNTPNALVWWFKDTHTYIEKTRVNNTRFLKLISRSPQHE